MNKITTDIISTTGINIKKYDILPSKVFINGVEITDTESWNKAINKIDEKNKEIERLNNIIDKQDRDITTLTKDKIKLKNIINELEKWLEEQKDFLKEISFIQTLNEIQMEHKIMINDYQNVLDKLKELKEGNK